MKNQIIKKTPQKDTTSAHKKIKLLRTKAWSWSCAYFLSKTGDPLKGYSLKEVANNFFNQRNRAETSDANWWHYRLKGKQSVRESSVVNYWEKLINVYKIGPWAGAEYLVQFEDDCEHLYGGYVPLWDSLEGDSDKILKSWNSISEDEWEGWFLISDSRVKKVSNSRPSFFNNTIDLYNFTYEITQIPILPPLLALTASLTCARILGLKETKLFRRETETSHSLDLFMRRFLLDELSFLNISIEEIADVAKSYGLTISGFSDSYVEELNYPASFLKTLN